MSEKVVDKKLPSYLLSGKTAIVTGASRGIGRATALRLAEAGANVVVNYLHNAEAANEVVKLCQTIGVEALAVQADVGKLADAQRLTDKTIEKFGTFDILIANAGITRRQKTRKSNPAVLSTKNSAPGAISTRSTRKRSKSSIRQ